MVLEYHPKIAESLMTELEEYLEGDVCRVAEIDSERCPLTYDIIMKTLVVIDIWVDRREGKWDDYDEMCGFVVRVLLPLLTTSGND